MNRVQQQPDPPPAAGGSLRVILYSRVSTEAQAEQGLGLQMQDRAMRTWARQHNHKIVAAYSDSGISGSNGLDTRPGLADALAELERGKADALVVYRLDRLARKLAYQETWIERVEQAGRQVVSVTEPHYGDDEMRTLVRQILGAVAQYERAVIRRRMQGGRAEKAARGGYAYGAPPYGWRAEGGALAPDPGEQEVRRRMAQMRSAGSSLREIADALNAGQVPPRRGDRWHPQTVARALEPRGPRNAAEPATAALAPSARPGSRRRPDGRASAAGERS